MLAGYMFVVGPTLLDIYTMLNLHPALPDGPTGTRSDVIRAILRSRPAEVGAMVHLVTAELDRGPAVAVARIPVESLNQTKSIWELDDETAFRKIEEGILRREPELVNRALEEALRLNGQWSATPTPVEI
jgi:folate-dependent phosphoribosylglycinamide formyltransferase PurN